MWMRNVYWLAIGSLSTSIFYKVTGKIPTGDVAVMVFLLAFFMGMAITDMLRNKRDF